jgi:alkylation response protein AidB-like acyl-CoA dehydrogenase
MMNHARVNVGLEGVGIAERAYQHALWYARERVQGKIIGDTSNEKKTILHHPDVRRMLMDIKSRTEAMRTLAYYSAANIDRAHAGDAAAQSRVDLLTPVVKGWSTEQGVELSSTALQVFGGVGFVEETGAAQYYRDSRITTIYEGTTAIQANDLVGRKLAREKVPGAAMNALIAEMTATAEEIAGNAQLAGIAANLKLGIAAQRK